MVDFKESFANKKTKSEVERKYVKMASKYIEKGNTEYLYKLRQAFLAHRERFLNEGQNE